MKARTLKYYLLGTAAALFLAALIYFHHDPQVVAEFRESNDTKIAAASFVPETFFITTGEEEGISPANIVFFEAERIGTETILIWEATDELSLVGFQVEKSCGDQPFERIGWVYSREISHKPNYDYTDHAPHFDESCIYRLKMVDFDGQTAFSPAVQAPAAKY